MSHTVSLVEALKPRAQSIAGVLSTRLRFPGIWADYKPSEKLEGELSEIDTVSYWRRSHPDTKIHFGFISMKDIKEEHRSAPTVIGNAIPERATFVVDFDKPVRYKETIEHEWSRTISFSEAAKQAWEVAAKASLSVEYAGIKGALEVSGKYGEELSRSHSESETERDKISKELEFTGPISFKMEANRSVGKESRVICARCEFDFKIYFETGCTGPNQERVWEWFNFHGVFIPIAKGLSPRNTDYSIFASSSPSYELFHNNPVRGEELERLTASSGKLVEFVVEYDNIIEQELRVV